MSGRFSLAASLAVLLMLTGCVVADGIAHVVKMSEKRKDAPAAATAAVQADVPAAAAPPLPPQPPPRDEVKVEELPSGR
ncbi:MAG TPA: hypothetical protein HPQ04_10515 [Rhodospirillaceae bacterium]|nr:hypothetical protein [Rhodospirillaceae bacterium]